MSSEQLPSTGISYMYVMSRTIEGPRASIPVLYLGQVSQSLAVEMDKICDYFGGLEGPSSTCVVDEIVTSRNQYKATRLLKCAHTLSELTEFCPICSQNSEHLQDGVIRRMLEEQSNNTCQVCVVSDSYSQFGAWSAGIVTEYLQQETGLSKGGDCPSHQGILSVLMKPPLGCCRGLECLYSVLSAQHALDSSQGVIFRGYEGHHSDQSTTASSTNTSSAIACDLYPILAATTTATGYSSSSNSSSSSKHVNSHSQVRNLHSYLTSETVHGDMQYHLWPLDVCRAQSKIMDARSSLSALLKKLLKATPKSGVEYNPLRSVSSNVHHLHLSYTELYGTKMHSTGPSTSAAITAANYANLLVPGSALTKATVKYKSLLFRDVPHTEHDIAVALSWATPGTSWPYRNNNKSHTGGADVKTTHISGDSEIDSSVYSKSSSHYSDNSESTPFADITDVSISDTNTTSRNRTVNKKNNPQHVRYPQNAINSGSRAGGGVSAQDTTEDDVSVFTRGSARSTVYRNNNNRNTFGRGNNSSSGGGGGGGGVNMGAMTGRLGISSSSSSSTYSISSSSNRAGSAYSSGTTGAVCNLCDLAHFKRILLLLFVMGATFIFLFLLLLYLIAYFTPPLTPFITLFCFCWWSRI